MQVWVRRLRMWAAAVIVPVCVVGAGFAQAHYSNQDEGKRQARYLIAALLLAAAAAAAPVVDTAVRNHRRRSHQTRLEEALSNQIVVVNDALDPLVSTLGDLILEGSDDKKSGAQRLIQQALNSAAHVVGPERTRVSYFEADAAAEPYQLKAKAHAGRAQAPRTVFRADRTDGEWVIGLLERNEHHFCPSVKDSPPPGWDASRRRTYETFISVPATIGSEAVGMITADAPKTGDLLEKDVAFLRVLGTIVAAAITIAEQQG